MTKNHYQKYFLIAAFLCLSSLLVTPVSGAQDKSLEERVSTVESNITRLEQKVDELQKMIDQLLSHTPQAANIMRKGNWKNISNWRTGLQKGMTKIQVRELMGEPNKIETYTMLGEDWLYGLQGSGEIHFSPKGVLESWKEPIPDDLK
ncbi:MAG: hypothetical protein NT096_04275 [Proteobacteria bacterium]|nr:hypothetical protein [Pseudomonadota bacterium]